MRKKSKKKIIEEREKNTLSNLNDLLESRKFQLDSINASLIESRFNQTDLSLKIIEAEYKIDRSEKIARTTNERFEDLKSIIKSDYAGGFIKARFDSGWIRNQMGEAYPSENIAQFEASIIRAFSLLYKDMIKRQLDRVN